MTLEEKLKIAWRRIKADRRTDFIIGNFEYEVFERYADFFIKRIAAKVNNEQLNYTPEALRKWGI